MGTALLVDVAGLVAKFLEGYGTCDPARIPRARLIAVLLLVKLPPANPLFTPRTGVPR